MVLRFATGLRTLGGVDAELDLFHGTSHENWNSFGPTHISTSDFVLIAIDETYGRRWSFQETPGVGAGAARESAAIKAIFDRDQQEFLRRVKVVVLPGASAADIPDDLRGVAERFVVPSFDEAGLEPLLRTIWGRPAFPKPPLGEIPALPPRALADIESGRSEFLEALGDTVDEWEGVATETRLDPSTVQTSIEELQRAESAAKKSDLSPVAKALQEALGDHDSMVRFTAMSELGDHLSPELIPVIEPLLKDRDSDIRRYAIEYWARLGAPDTRERLVEALGDHDSMVRFTAMSELGDHLSPELIPVIEPLLKDRDSDIRRYAIEYWARIA